jgi:aarF domain-containing kinase
MRGLAPGSEERKERMLEFHGRSAAYMLRLCLDNGGIFTKLGQHLASLNHALPAIYTDTLSQLQDQANSVPFEQVEKLLLSELSVQNLSELFLRFDREPLAAASLAQVHHAIALDGRHLAVKVQYPRLQSQTDTDLAMLRFSLRAIEFFFPDFTFQWILPEFENALRGEVRATPLLIPYTFGFNSQH